MRTHATRTEAARSRLQIHRPLLTSSRPHSWLFALRWELSGGMGGSFKLTHDADGTSRERTGEKVGRVATSSRAPLGRLIDVPCPELTTPRPLYAQVRDRFGLAERARRAGPAARGTAERPSCLGRARGVNRRSPIGQTRLTATSCICGIDRCRYGRRVARDEA